MARAPRVRGSTVPMVRYQLPSRSTSWEMSRYSDPRPTKVKLTRASTSAKNAVRTG